MTQDVTKAAQFDPAAFQQDWKPAETALMRRLKAVEDVEAATSTKDAARARIFGDKEIIERLLAKGISQALITADYASALPHIPKADIHNAMESLRKQRSKTSQRVQPPSQPIKPVAAPVARAVTGKPNSTTSAVSLQPYVHSVADMPAWADGSDKLASESDEEYALRKSIEGDPKGRAKFIGESKS